jgi:hypothetical protein
MKLENLKRPFIFQAIVEIFILYIFFKWLFFFQKAGKIGHNILLPKYFFAKWRKFATKKVTGEHYD